jgi:hypothetical protein
MEPSYCFMEVSMSEAERLAVEVIGRWETEQQQRAQKAKATTRVEEIVTRARAIGTHLTTVQANYLLGQLNEREYLSVGGATSPVYKAIARGLIRTSEQAGVTVLETNSFIVWLRQYKPRPRDTSQTGQGAPNE